MADDLLANFQYSRQQQRYTNLSGVTPTIPVLTGATMTAYTEADNMVLGNFTDTDILDSEIFLNTSDDRVFIRSNDSILEFLMAGGSGSTYNSGNAITVGTGNTINLGGNLTSDSIINGLSGTSSMYIGSYGPDQQLSTFAVGARDGIQLLEYENNQISSNLSLGSGVAFLSSNYASGYTAIHGGYTYVSSFDNKKIDLVLTGGIAPGSGESFTLNGVTFTEGIDFIGQNDAILDAATIAGLVYTGVTDFLSVVYYPGDDSVVFNFSTPVTASISITNGYISDYLFTNQLALLPNGLFLTSGNNGLIINQNAQHKFIDDTAIPKGIQYGANYDATLVDDSLVPKRYVDNAISGATLTGGNAITIGTGNTIDLGGTLTQPTVISGNSQTFDLGVTGSELTFLRVKSIQSQEDYKFGGEGLEIIQNPGTFRTEFDYTSSSGFKSQIWQAPNSVYTLASSNSGTTTSQIIQTPGIINILTNTDNTTLSESGLVLDQPSDSFRFVDNRLAHRGLEYDADYSSGYTPLSLITKGDLDTAISGATFSGGSGNCITDLYVTNIHGCSPITIKDELIIESGITGTGNIDITGNVISDIVQLRGGVGTQGEMSWNTDEETVQLVMDGTTLHIGQDTFVHARNNTASIITKGTAVYATGTLGASGRITVAPMIADGSIPGRYFIGLAAEDIAISADGQVMTFGKIRQINTSGYTDGDVLWLSDTVAGELTTTEPSAPSLKIATAFVIHAATNGTLMVRAEQGTDLHSDQRVQVSGLTDGDVLTWSNANQRWENQAASGGDFEPTRFGLNLSGKTDLKIETNKLLVGDVNGFAEELSFSGVSGIVSLDVNDEVVSLEAVEIYNILKEETITADKQLALLDINSNVANVKAKFEISAIAVENTTANSVTINIGSTSGGTDVANSVVIGANALIKLPLATTFFSITTGTDLYISSGAWNSASLNIHVTISKIWQ